MKGKTTLIFPNNQEVELNYVYDAPNPQLSTLHPRIIIHGKEGKYQVREITDIITSTGFINRRIKLKGYQYEFDRKSKRISK